MTIPPEIRAKLLHGAADEFRKMSAEYRVLALVLSGVGDDKELAALSKDIADKTTEWAKKANAMLLAQAARADSRPANAGTN